MPRKREPATSSPPTETGEEPAVDIETALRWLLSTKPNEGLSVLKDPDFAPLAARAFLGFRFNAQGYQNPVVRRRLAEEIVREPKFREKMQALVESPSPQHPPLLRDGEQENASIPQPTSLLREMEQEIEGLKAQLRAEREARKRERGESRAAIDELKKASAELTRQIEERGAASTAAAAEADTLRQALNRAQERIDRLERQNRRLKVENVLLAKAKPISTPADQPTPVEAREDVPVAQPSPFEAAAYRLVSQENLEAALVVAEAALKEDPGNAVALEIAADVYRKTGQEDHAARAARDLALTHLRASNAKSATDALLTLLSVDPATGLAEGVMRQFALGLRGIDPAQLTDIAASFARFRTVNPGAYRRLAKLVDEYVPEASASVLTSGLASGPNDPLPLQMPEPLTPSAIVDAVDGSNEDLVISVRRALAQLRDSSPDDYGRAISTIAAATGGDESYLKPLIGQTRGPAIVDASNAAWYDDAQGVADRPRLRQVLAVRAAIRRRGFFPILLIADAPLPHTIDDRDAFARMIARGEVTLSTTGTDADETILREAKRLGATVVSNDYMADWDPDGEVRKLRFIIPSSGPAYLLG